MPGTLPGDVYVANATDYMKLGLFEAITQNLGVFNGFSRNAIRFAPGPGFSAPQKDEVFFSLLTDLVRRQNIASDAAVSPNSLSTAYTNRTALYTATNFAAALHTLRLSVPGDPGTPENRRALANTWAEIGRQRGNALLQYTINMGLAALVGAIQANTDAVYDARNNATSANQKISSRNLFKARQLLGDAADSIVVWVGHSQARTSLQINAYDNQVAQSVMPIGQGTLPGILVNLGSSVTPMLVTDNDLLYTPEDSGDSTDADTCILLGLTADAVRITMHSQDIVGPTAEANVGNEQISYSVQMQERHDIAVKGYRFGGAENPTAAQLAVAGSWTRAVSDVKSGPGVMLIGYLDS